MSIPIRKSEGKDFKITPAGNHVARCYQILHIGSIPSTFPGENKNVSKTRLTFELPDELNEFRKDEGLKPFSISVEHTVSMNEKANLRKFIEGWLGETLPEEEEACKSFNLHSMIGKTCMLNVVHKPSRKTNKPFALIVGASPVPKGIEVPEAVNEPRYIDYDNITADVFESLPNFIKDKMKTSEEFQTKFGLGIQEVNPVDHSETGDTSFPPKDDSSTKENTSWG